jgi:hypothetical protein
MSESTQQSGSPAVDPKAVRPWWRKKRFIIPLILVVLVLLTSLGGGNDDETAATGTTTTTAAGAVAESTTTAAPTTTTAPKNKPEMSMAEFTALQTGMTYEEAVALIGGPGVEQSRSELAGTTTVMYMWEGSSLGANANAMFQDNKLISKAQFGLK